MTGDDYQAIFRALFDRDISPEYAGQLAGADVDLEAMLRAALNSDEFKTRIAREYGVKTEAFRRDPSYLEHSGVRFRVPRELQVTPTPLKRVLLVGNCLLADWPHHLRALGVTAEIDHVLPTHDAPPVAPHPPEAYSFQVTHIANRAVFGDYQVFDWIHAGYGGVAAAEALLEQAKARLDRALELWTTGRASMPVFVANLLPPQQEFNGRLVPQLGLDSIAVLFERLNAYLRARIAELGNVYLLDIVGIFATIGTRHLQDDSFFVSAHAALVGAGMAEHDRHRLVPSRTPPEYYDIKDVDALAAAWFEAEAMYRTLLQIDQVKMVCVDLDDTLWRGVLAEAAEIGEVDGFIAREGWPIGVVEALAILKRRGVLLALISKNARERVQELFAKVYRGIIALEDFAICKINWAPKAENIAAAMAEANLLPRSVVFLDDNPAERAAVKQAFPEIRVIEAPHYYWRRILMWSAETQTATITQESARRTEMVQAQAARETFRAEASHQDFLAGLNLKLRIAAVEPGTKRFERALELLNKSNQFNTTGRRWSAQALAQVCSEGLVASVDVSDRFTDYGETLVAVVCGDAIEQLAMSCRVVGLGVEIAAVAAVAQKVLSRGPEVVAQIVETDANILCRDLYARCGFALSPSGWVATAAPETPPHIAIENAL